MKIQVSDSTTIQQNKQDITGSNRASETKRTLDVAGIEESIRIDEVSSSITYFGFAKIGSLTSSPVWKIKKMTVSGTVTAFTFANGSELYDQIFDDRASLTYT